MPAAAFQYCEAMRVASSYGWHVFPPKDIHLNFDGKEVFFFQDGQWFPMKSTNFEAEFREHWASLAPENLEEKDPPFLTELFVPGMVQIWSGYFLETNPGWSTLIRPVSNFDVRSSFSCFEGLVETDRFNPLPLFINIKLNATNREIYIPMNKPLFQIQPVLKESYGSVLSEGEIIEMDRDNEDIFPWQKYLNTVRDNETKASQKPGRYAVSIRKSTK